MASTLGEIAKRRGWIDVLLIGAALVAVFFALPQGSIEQSTVYDIVGLGAIAAAFIGIRLHRPAGVLPWVLMGIGQLAFVIGDVIWTVYEAQGINPYPSIADVAYLAGYPLIGLGLVIGIRRRITGGDRASILDAAILATAAAVIWWAFVLGPLAASADPDPLSFGISIAYPVGDLLLIGMSVGLLLTPGVRSASFGLLIGGLVLFLMGDLVFGLQSLEGTYVDGGLLDGVWLVAYLVFAAAAAHPTMDRLFDPHPVSISLLGPLRLCLLALAMLVGPALLAVQRSVADPVVMVVAGATAVLSLLIIARLAGMVGHLARDIARRQVLEEQLSYQAFHDPLTGLANRRRFMESVTVALATGAATAALFLDIDDFKDVNDNMGHDAGDAVLSAVGHRIVASIRPGDLACRLGGDEFAVLLPETPALVVAESIAERLVAVLAAPIEVEGIAVKASASVGVALRGAGEPMPMDELLRRSDVAMYHAKARGKHQVASYSPEFDEASHEWPRAAVRRSAPAA